MRIEHIIIAFTILFFSHCSGYGASFTSGNSVSGSGQNLLFDDFNRSDGLLGPWTVSGNGAATFQISQQRAHPFSTGNDGTIQAYHNTNVPQQNIKVSVSVVISGGAYSNTVALAAKLPSTSLTSGYLCGNIDFNGSLAFHIYRVDPGLSLVSLASSSAISLPDNSISVLSFVYKDGNLTCSITGAANVSLSANDNTYGGNGYFGLFGGQDNNYFVYFDDFKVDSQ